MSERPSVEELRTAADVSTDDVARTAWESLNSRQSQIESSRDPQWERAGVLEKSIYQRIARALLAEFTITRREDK